MSFDFNDQGITTVFTDTAAKANMPKMDSVMLNLFYGFLKTIDCTSIELNSTYRPGKSNGSHSYGRALDINRITFNQNGTQKTIYFNLYFSGYNDKGDESFYNAVKSHFGSKLYNYYSPAIIKHAGQSTELNNQFRYAKNKLEVLRNMENKERSQRGLHESHLNHLHVAIDYDGKMLKDNVIGYQELINKKKSNSSDWTSLIPPAILAGYALKEYMRKK